MVGFSGLPKSAAAVYVAAFALNAAGAIAAGDDYQPRFDVSSVQLGKAIEALELRYISQHRWSAVSCRDTKVEELTFVYCEPVEGPSGHFGGLFAVTYDDTGEVAVTPFNGKAMQHFRDVHEDLYAVDMEPVRLLDIDESGLREFAGLTGEAVEHFQ